MNTHRKNQRGIALPLVAVFLVVILGFTAIGIDVSRLVFTATEVQAVADAAATAGAMGLAESGGVAGDGIDRAKLIASHNIMNGELAPDADVVVDEGFWNFDTHQFECCTSNTPCCADGTWGKGTLTCSSPGAGELNGDCTRRAAVLATPKTTVNNLFAGVLDFINTSGQITANASGNAHDTTKVEKVAIASPAGPAAACQVPEGCGAGDWGCYCDHGVAPCLPITAPACEFPPACIGSECQLPTLQVSSNGSDTAAWWTPEGVTTSDNNVRSYLAQGPCDPPGANELLPPTTIGPDINVNNGLNGAAENQLFGLTRCLAGLGLPPQGNTQPQGCAIDSDGHIIPGERGRVFMIPIVDSDASCTDNFVQSRPVVGFATIEITAVSTGNPRTVSITTIDNSSDPTTQLGGNCFGTSCKIVMTR